MKKKCIVILIIIVSFIFICTRPTFSQFGGYAEFGKDTDSCIAYTEIRLQYTFDVWWLHVTPYGIQTTWFKEELIKKWKGYPFRDIYTVGLEMRYKKFTLGVNHYCSHAVEPKNTKYREYNEHPSAYDFSKIYMRYEF